MSKWEMVKLGDVCSFVNGDRGKNYPSRDVRTAEGVPFINAGHLLDTKLDVNNLDYIPRNSFELLGSGKIRRGDILFCLRGSLGKFASVGELCEGAIASSLVIIRPTNAVIGEYILAYLGSPICAAQILLHKNGAAQPNLSVGKLSEFLLPLPNVEIQKKIAKTFGTASELIALRKKQIAELDNLIKSTFYDMFGDPVINEKGWDKSLLSTLGVLKNGMNFSSLDSGVSIHCLGVGDFQKYYKIENTELLPKINLNKMPTADYLLQDRDIVFVRSNGNKALVGRSVLVYPGDITATFSGFCIRFRATTKELLATYLIQVLHNASLKKQLLSNGRGANITNLNQQMLSAIEIPVPPTSLQEQFSRIVTKIEEQKAFVQKAIDESQYLFDSLMSEYFE